MTLAADLRAAVTAAMLDYKVDTPLLNQMRTLMRHAAERIEPTVPNIDMSRVTMLFEIRGNYDGWSVAEYEDGSLHIRWPEDSPFYPAAKEFVDRLEDQRD